MIDVFQKIGAIANPNGKVPPMPEHRLITLEKFRGKEERYHRHEFSYNNWDYEVLFGVEYTEHEYQDEEPDFDCYPVQVKKCHSVFGNELYPVYTFTQSEWDEIIQTISESWLQLGHADDPRYACPVNCDTKAY